MKELTDQQFFNSLSSQLDEIQAVVRDWFKEQDKKTCYIWANKLLKKSLLKGKSTENLIYTFAIIGFVTCWLSSLQDVE